MNCKKCIHFNVCPKAKNPENYAIQGCKDFKDKENYAEIVRCKDCQFYIPYGNFRFKGKTMRFCHLQNRLSCELGFCDEGKRKKGGENNA